MQTGNGALRFTLARTVNLVAVSPGPRSAVPGALPAHVRLVDLATAAELAELAAALEVPAAPAPDDAHESDAADAAPAPDPGALDGLVARAEARVVETRTGTGHAGS